MSFDLETEHAHQSQDYEALLEDTIRELATNEPNDDPGSIGDTIDDDTLTTAWFVAGFEMMGGKDTALTD